MKKYIVFISLFFAPFVYSYDKESFFEEPGILIEQSGILSQIVELNITIQFGKEKLKYKVTTPYYNSGEISFERDGVNYHFKIRPLFKEGDFINLEITYIIYQLDQKLGQFNFKTVLEVGSPWELKIQGEKNILFTLIPKIR